VQHLRDKVTYANVVSTIALVLALGGATAFAASTLSKNSVGTKQLKKNAVTGVKVKDGSLTGADVNASTLGQVPSAKAADSAKTAQRSENATRADSAARADQADTAARAGTAARASDADRAALATRAITADQALTVAPPENMHVVGAPGEPAFGAGWENFGSNRQAEFFIDHGGVVHLQGEVKRTNGNNTTIFRLPPQYAPAPDDGKVFLVIDSQGVLGRLFVEGAPDGEVNFIGPNAQGVFLDGITWRARN
jgi:hypothetical protein